MIAPKLAIHRPIVQKMYEHAIKLLGTISDLSIHYQVKNGTY